VRVMDALASLTPKRLWITKLDEKGGNASVTGVASTFDDVSAFMTALKGDPHFSSVELSKTSAMQNTTGKKIELVDFALTMQIIYAPKKPAAPGQPVATPR